MRMIFTHDALDSETDLDASSTTEVNQPPVGTHDTSRLPEWPLEEHPADD